LNTTCYHSSNAGVIMSEKFEGAWSNHSLITVQGMTTDEQIPVCEILKGGNFVETVGCNSGQTIVSSLPGWVQHRNTNCWQGQGAAEVAPDAYAPDEGITPVACMAACAASFLTCTAVVTSSAGECYLRNEVDLNSCEEATEFDFWMAPNSVLKTASPSAPVIV